MAKRIYVAASSQHVGKTTSTLGLLAALKRKGHKVGYCKPVGQEHININNFFVDKDAILFSTVMDFILHPEIHSPVILDSGATQRFLDNPSKFRYKDHILKASSVLNKENDIVLYEGTGHPGVGAVVGLSNADVAKLLDAKVILVVEGGIGNTIDRIMLCLSHFKEKKVPVIGIIVNKVIPDKLEKVRHYIGLFLAKINIPLLGVVPFDASLLYPIMETIRQSVNGVVLQNQEFLDNKVENIVAGSLVETEEFPTDKQSLLVVSARRLDEAVEKIKTITLKNPGKTSPIAGIITTSDGRNIAAIDPSAETTQYISENKIPLIATNLDTYGAVYKVSRIEVKINTRTQWKIKRAIDMIDQHVDLTQIVGK
jgi:dethiobiotin synthetase